MLTEEEEEEEALQPGLEKSLSCSFPSLRTDVRAAEDWKEPGQSWEGAALYTDRQVTVLAMQLRVPARPAPARRAPRLPRDPNHPICIA